MERCLGRLSALLATLLLASELASACQCGGGNVSSCTSLSLGYGVVFVGTVQSIESAPITDLVKIEKSSPAFAPIGPTHLSLRERYRAYKDVVILNFAVQESFKGVHSPKIAIRVGRFAGSCGFETKPGELYFKKGEKYLVYAYEWNGNWITNICSPTRLASVAAPQIEELRRLRDLLAPRVVGDYVAVRTKGATISPSGQTVTLKGSNGDKIPATVQADGRFWIAGIPPGAYEVSATTPPSYRLRAENAFRIKDRVPVNPQSIRVEPDGCTEMELYALPDGEISGRVLDGRGKPLKEASVRLWNADDVSDLGHWWGWERPDEHGTFRLGPLGPGKYVIGVYIWSPEKRKQFMSGSSDAKPELWFYPGVDDLRRARSITLSFAQHRSDILLRVPAVR